mgnify:CR=1 FL=1
METNGISGLSAYRIFATETKTSTLSPMRYFNYRDGIDNSLTPVARRMVTILVEMLLDPLRRVWGSPIVISSGYRCPELNILIGGAKHSHHLLGCAADLIAGSPDDHPDGSISLTYPAIFAVRLSIKKSRLIDLSLSNRRLKSRCTKSQVIKREDSTHHPPSSLCIT